MKKLMTICFCFFLIMPTVLLAQEEPYEDSYDTSEEFYSMAATPAVVQKYLKDGNKEYVNESAKPRDQAKLDHKQAINFERRQEFAFSQDPYAVILGCSDSRVAPEILFNKGINHLFTIRVAGNVFQQNEIESALYATDHLGSSLVVALGHTKCGAVKEVIKAFAFHLEQNPTPSKTLPANIHLPKLLAPMWKVVYRAYHSSDSSDLGFKNLKGQALADSREFEYFCEKRNTYDAIRSFLQYCYNNRNNEFVKETYERLAGTNPDKPITKKVIGGIYYFYGPNEPKHKSPDETGKEVVHEDGSVGWLPQFRCYDACLKDGKCYPDKMTGKTWTCLVEDPDYK